MIKSRRRRRAENVACMGEKINAYKIVIGKAEGRTALGRPRLRFEDNIKMGPAELVCEGLDWIYMITRYGVWSVLLYMVMAFGFHKKAGNFLTI
jgi:hypothetical protein